MEPARTAVGDPGRGRLPQAERHALRRMVVRSLGSVVVLLVLYFVLPLDGVSDASTVLLLVVCLLAVAALLAFQIFEIARADHPRLRAIETLALSGSLFLLVFAAGYFMVGQNDVGAFSEPLTRLDALYLTITVFATVGFGDIVPRTDGARILVMVQMVGDLVLIGVVAKLLIGAVNVGVQRRAGERRE
jgi:small-conductance mechanosensitive channel